MSGLAQKQLVIGLVVIAALLAGIIGLLVWQNSSSVPEVNAQAPTTTEDPNATQSQMPPVGAPDNSEFDPATAPAVPAEETPEQYVTRYYQLCQDGDYTAAFTLLPTATQAYYGDSASFQATLEGYGITAFEVSPQVENGDQIQVVGTQQAQGMGFPYTWTFVQGEDGSWLAASRAMGGN